MHKTTIFCDCCGHEIKELSGYELTGQLRAQGGRWHATGEIDLPVIELRDICDPCAVELHAAISRVIADSKTVATF